MKKLFLMLPLIVLGGCGGCSTNRIQGHFFVKSQDEGYLVCAETFNGFIDPTCITRPYSRADEAQRMADRLNQDMDGQWPK